MTYLTDFPPAASADTSLATPLDGHAVYDRVPLGATLRYFDGAPRPPERFTRKLRTWQCYNGVARLNAKSAPLSGSYLHPATITLREGAYGSEGSVSLLVNREFEVTTLLRFEIIDVPKPGMVRVFSRRRGTIELHRLTSDMAEAEAWMARNRYCDPIAEIVGEDETSTIGRAA